MEYADVLLMFPGDEGHWWRRRSKQKEHDLNSGSREALRGLAIFHPTAGASVQSLTAFNNGKSSWLLKRREWSAGGGDAKKLHLKIAISASSAPLLDLQELPTD